MKFVKKQLQGLTQVEVKQRIDDGKTNYFKAKAGSSNWDIFRRNVFNSFNMLNFAIFVALIAVQAWSNLFFFGIIVLNAFTGMMTELRARRMVDKLNLMNQDQIRVVRDGQLVSIDPKDIVLDDIMLLSAGEQVPSDAVVVDGMAELNEAMLTGESDQILKKDGKELLSGSYLVSGQVYAKVINVAEDNYANKLMLEAKTHKPIVSCILYNMDKIAKFTGKIVIPFGLALFFEAYMIKQLSLQESVVTSSTALLGMLPKGITLLTITSLLTAVIKLGMKHILVQEMYSVETLARVDVLCLDKTGTITQGKMTVKGLELLSERFTKEELERLLAAYMQHSKDKNATAQAIRNAYEGLEHHYQVGDVIPFSSNRKWGAVSINGLGTLFLGAPEMLLKIISGDNPVTVSHIAHQAGFADYQSYIDCSKISDEELEALAEDTAIFGRVSPHQKKLLIQTLNANGHTTAMTGDGVNDILALREADCSIVMAEGDPATRQIANLVLMDSEFKDIPEILFEGRRVVNNIAHIAPIFLIKTVYSFLLGLICIGSIVFGKAEYLLVFPFIQVQMTLTGQFIEGLPPFVLTFERNIRPVEKHFLRRSLQLAIPNALMLVISVLIFHLSQVYLGMSSTDMLTLSYYMMGSTGVLAVIRACIPLNMGRVALIIYSVFGFLISSYYLRDVIAISTLNSYTLPIYLVAMAICTPLFFWISYKQGAFQKAQSKT